tara:strand:- start:1765 stop:2457 length:693 start_codon:yes stop_codon:yes gene_type:complete
MDKSSLDFFLNENVQIDTTQYISSLICAAILSILIQIVYNKFSTTLSNKIDFSKNFVVLGITTTIVIMIVKNSIALSLGLVGALSIVRFRAAIKEPEELVYLFLVIAAGLGCGSGQIKITLMGIIFSLIIVVFYSLFFNKSKQRLSEQLNLSLVTKEKIDEKEINKLVDIIKDKTLEAEFISLVKTEEETNINFDVKLDDFNKLNDLIKRIELSNKNFKIIVARANNLTL